MDHLGLAEAQKNWYNAPKKNGLVQFFWWVYVFSSYPLTIITQTKGEIFLDPTRSTIALRRKVKETVRTRICYVLDSGVSTSVFPAVSKRRDLYIDITVMSMVYFMMLGEETRIFLWHRIWRALPHGSTC